MNYEIILTIIVSNSLKFELVQFFLDQTLGGTDSSSKKTAFPAILASLKAQKLIIPSKINFLEYIWAPKGDLEG